MPKLILGLTGQIGCGKGTICTYLTEAYGAQVFKFSTYLTRALRVMGLEPSRDHLIKMSEAMRGAFGEDALSHALARDAAQCEAPVVVVDGIRRVQDLAGLDPLPNFKLAAVDVDQRIRYERIANRGEKTEESAMPWEEFLSQEQRSTEITVPGVMERATLRIDNNGTTEDLQRHVDALLTQLGIQKI